MTRTSHIAEFDGLWQPLTAEIPEARLLQTLFALVFTANSGHQQVGFVTESSDNLEFSTVEALVVDYNLRVSELANCWTVQHLRMPEVDDPALRAAVAFSVLELPAFQVATHDVAQEPRKIADPIAFPACCTVILRDDSAELCVETSEDLLNGAELSALAEQFTTAATFVAQNPAATAGDAIRVMRDLRYKITIVAESGFGPLANILEAYGQQIGLPVVVSRIQLGETQVADFRYRHIGPQARGANLILAGPDNPILAAPVPEAEDLLVEYRQQFSVGILPDGNPIFECNPNETRQLFDEIFRRRQYLRHGVRIHDEDLVVDVGANTGMFCIFAHIQARAVQIHAFEPIPSLANILEANLRLYGIKASVSRTALGSSSTERSMVFYPRSSLQSSLYADKVADEVVVRGYAHRQAATLPLLSEDNTSQDVSEAVDSLMQGRFAFEEHLVPVLPLSAWIREQRIERIDLLKIDVERAELDVLNGIGAEHWPIIRQLAIEIHNIEHRTTQVQSFLEGLGFTVTIEQDELFAGSEIFMLYAYRPTGVPNDIVDRDAAARQVAAAARWSSLSPVPVYIAPAPATDIKHSSWARILSELTACTPEVTYIDLAVGSEDLHTSAAADTDTEQVWAATGAQLMRRMTVSERPVVKAVVVDADNTLWGGICGEVGPENVDKAGPFLAVQHFLASQRAAGRALCLCSRNNLADVEAVFRLHPDMPLRLADFTAIRTGWGPKSRSIAALADELAFAPSSLVYLDDSAADRAEVALAHPGITVVDLPDDPHEFIGCLRATWQLDIQEQTAEDGLRARFSTAENHRRALAETAPTFETYLRRLDLKVTVTPSGESDVGRISQLARRTTQFNLMLRSHTAATIRQLMAEGTVALSIRVSDRFGDYGLVGFIAARHHGDVLEVQDFFLSCRALGRNVEWYMLRTLGERARADGIRSIALTARPGPRNAPGIGFVSAVRHRCGAQVPPDALTALVTADAILSVDWTTAADAESPVQPEHVKHRVPAAGVGYRWPAPGLPTEELARALRCGSARSRSGLAVPYVPVRTQAESIIADVFRAALRADEIGVYDNLFALGGDSLTAMTICAQLRQGHGIIVTVDTVLDHPTIADIARQLTRGVSSPRHADPGTVPVGEQDASPGQRRIWAAEMIGDRGNAQVIPLAYKIRGPIDTGRLETALGRVIDRHPALRTRLVMRGRGLMRQITGAQFRLRVADVVDVAEEDRAAAADTLAMHFHAERFTAGSDVMLRALAIRLSATETMLVVLIHHSAADGRSVGILQRDISAFYRGVEPPGAPKGATFADYTRLSQARDRQGDFTAGLAAVASALKPFRAVSSRPDRTVASSEHNAEPRHTWFPLSHTVLSRTRKLAEDCSTTPFAVFLVAFQLLVGIAEGSDATVIGCPVANRGDGRFEHTVGFFANLVPVPTRFRWEVSLGSHLRSASVGVFESLRYAEVPYGLLASRLNADLSMAAGPPFEAVFTLQEPPSHPLGLAGCEVSRADPAIWPLPFPLMLDVEEHGGEGRGLLRYDGAAPLAAVPDWYATAYPLVLTAFWTLPHRPLRFLRELLCPTEGAAQARQRAQQARHRRLRVLRSGGIGDDSGR